MDMKVVVATGSNKDNGYAVVRHFCKEFDGVVYLTAGDIEQGKKAVEELNKEGLKPEFHQLDVTDEKSVETFRDYIKSKYEGIDVLVNAAIVSKHSATERVSVQAERTLFMNYFSLVSTCEILFPLLKNGAQVYNIYRSIGRSILLPSKDLRDKLIDEKLTIPELSKLMKQYVDAAKEGTHAAEWGNFPYVVSKMGVIALSNIQQRMLDSKDIKVYSACEDTDMASHGGTRGLPLITSKTPLAAIRPLSQGHPGQDKQPRRAKNVGKPSSDAKPTKRARSDESLTYERLNYLSVAVMLEPYHDLTKEQAEAIEGQLQGVLDEKIFSPGASSAPVVAPRFRDKALYSEGALKMWCNDVHALHWLRQSLSNIPSPREGTELVVKRQSEIPKRIKAGFLVPEIGSGDTQVGIKKRLIYQNSQYNVGNWAFYRADAQEENKCLYLELGIPEEDVLKLKANELRVYYKLGSLYVHLNDEHPAHQQTHEEPAPQGPPPKELEDLSAGE